VLDEWFENEVKPRFNGKSTLVRFADDAVMAFEDFLDTTRVLVVLGKRLGRYELMLHPDKTRFVEFRFKRPDGKAHPNTDGTTFTFLGFCHVWGKSQNGKAWRWAPKRRPALTAPARAGVSIVWVGAKKQAFKSNKETRL
jgi:RNA-directed DNA polymerase